MSSADAPVRFGIVSDTHVTGPECADGLKRILEFFRESRVDAVLHCGDLTNLGYRRELAVFETVWNETMPGNVCFIAAMGNRDLSDTGKFPKESRERERDRLLIGEASRKFGIRSFDVNGVGVIAVDWRHEGELEAHMATHPKLRDPSKPLIVIQHPHPKGTVFSASGWMADDGRAGGYLKLFPRAMSFSGHSHVPLATAGSLWRGEFTAAAAGSYYLGPRTATGGREVSVLEVFPRRAVLARHDLATGAASTNELVAVDLKLPRAEGKGEFTFVQWNAGNFSYGQCGESSISAETAPERADDYRRFIRALGADFIGISEFNPVFDRGGGQAVPLLFGDFASVVCGPHRGYQGNALVAARHALKGMRSRAYARRVQPTYALFAETEIDGRMTTLVQTHLDFDAEARAAQIAELADVLKDESCVILSGDFNVSSASEYAPLIGSGFVAANVGPFGALPTHRRRDFVLTPAIDNVLVRGFEFADVGLGDPSLSLSDHRPLVCRLRIKTDRIDRTHR